MIMIIIMINGMPSARILLSTSRVNSVWWTIKRNTLGISYHSIILTDNIWCELQLTVVEMSKMGGK